MPLEELPRSRLGLGEEQRLRHGTKLPLPRARRQMSFRAELRRDFYNRPERSTPQSSHNPSTAESTNPMNERKFTPAICGPCRREDPDQARADQAADDDERDHEPVERDVELAHELVEALVHEADLDLAVARLLEDVVQLVGQVARDPRQLDALRGRASACAAGV